MLSDLTLDQRALSDYMSDLSEEAFAASWMDSLEFALWQAVQSGPQEYGRLQLKIGHLHQLVTLSNKCGGWIYWHPTQEETFSPIEKWEIIYDEQTAS